MQTGYFRALIFAVLLHGVLLALLSFSFAWQQTTQASMPAPALAIQAAVVDETLIVEELARLEEADRRIRDAETERTRKLQEQAEQARAKREQEQARLAKLERERIAAEQKAQQREKAADEARQKEAQAEAQRREKEQAERQRLAELEQKRIAEEQRLAALAEKQRKEAQARRRAEAEAKLQAEREEQLRRAVAEETARREAEDSGLLAEYLTLIEQRIVRNWIKPPGATSGLRCELLLTQIPGGEVTGFRVVSCNGDAVVIQSIERAVFQASPLPSPPDPRLFDRNVRVIFEPKD